MFIITHFYTLDDTSIRNHLDLSRSRRLDFTNRDSTMIRTSVLRLLGIVFQLLIKPQTNINTNMLMRSLRLIAHVQSGMRLNYFSEIVNRIKVGTCKGVDDENKFRQKEKQTAQK